MISALAGGLAVLVLIAAAIFLFIFWIMVLIDCVKRDFKKDNEKIVWVLVIVLLGFIGAAVYYFVVKANDKKIENKKSKK